MNISAKSQFSVKIVMRKRKATGKTKITAVFFGVKIVLDTRKPKPDLALMRAHSSIG